MIPMMTKEEFEKVVEVCTSKVKACEGCPLRYKRYICGVYLTEYIKNEPAPAATGTSSEVSVKEDTTSLAHLDDSTLLDICQDALEEISKIALDDYPNEFLTGYACAARDNIKRLRGGDGK